MYYFRKQSHWMRMLTSFPEQFLSSHFLPRYRQTPTNSVYAHLLFLHLVIVYFYFYILGKELSPFVPLEESIFDIQTSMWLVNGKSLPGRAGSHGPSIRETAGAEQYLHLPPERKNSAILHFYWTWKLYSH